MIAIFKMYKHQLYKLIIEDVSSTSIDNDQGDTLAINVQLNFIVMLNLLFSADTLWNLKEYLKLVDKLWNVYVIPWNTWDTIDIISIAPYHKCRIKSRHKVKKKIKREMFR